MISPAYITPFPRLYHTYTCLLIAVRRELTYSKKFSQPSLLIVVHTCRLVVAHRLTGRIDRRRISLPVSLSPKTGKGVKRKTVKV
jgi:hypothetical protein